MSQQTETPARSFRATLTSKFRKGLRNLIDEEPKALPRKNRSPASPQRSSTKMDVDNTDNEDRTSYRIKQVDGGLIFPEVDPLFHVKPENERFLGAINQMSKTAPRNVMLTGPQGCGKTEKAVWFAAKYERPLIIMNCAAVREARDWFGFRTADESGVHWHRSEFVRALETPNCVILLDEFNRLHSSIHNTLYPLLDARRQTFVEEVGEQIRVAPGVVFFSTANIGYHHTGTFTMDAAIVDRWGTRLEVDFLELEAETKVLMSKTGIDLENAKRLCKLASDLRLKARGLEATLSQTVSTRQLLETANLMQAFKQEGVPVVEALDYTLITFFSKEGGMESEQSQVTQLVQGIFGGKSSSD